MTHPLFIVEHRYLEITQWFQISLFYFYNAYRVDSIHCVDSNKWLNIGFGEEKGIIEIKIRTVSGALKVIA